MKAIGISGNNKISGGFFKPGLKSHFFSCSIIPCEMEIFHTGNMLTYQFKASVIRMVINKNNLQKPAGIILITNAAD
ncbi:hypothetical protein ES708_28863 [subsurface metagenome]